jgi:hypothetical protein
VSRLLQKKLSRLSGDCSPPSTLEADMNSHCPKCAVTWPCLFAYDALQAENARLRAVVDEAKEWHEQDCNCLCDCGECNKLPEPCALGASIAALGGRQ